MELNPRPNNPHPTLSRARARGNSLPQAWGREARRLSGLVRAAFAMIIIFSIAIPAKVSAVTPADKFVRTAVPFMTNVQPSDYDKLSKFDLLILPAELGVNQPQIFPELRQRNTNIVLLAYFPTKSYITGWGDSLHLAEKSGLNDSWYLRDASGNILSVWPGTQALSIASDWNRYAPQFVHDRILSTGLWDGIFYDEVSDSISWLNNGNVDLNRDYSPDGAASLDAAWKAGMLTLLTNARNLDPDKIFVINGTSTPEFQPLINGRMFETFPTPWEANGDWYEIMRRYLSSEPQVTQPETIIINSNAKNTGNQGDYKAMRFGLASALMGNAYFGFDGGDQSHSEAWSYDEYAVNLGKPTGSATKVTGSASLTADAANGYRLSAGVWQRDFQNGIALVNPTGTAQAVVFDSEYEKIRGSQDPAANDGSIVSSVSVGAKDGLLMLRPLDKISGAPYVNGAFVRVLDAKGASTRTGFFAYDSRFKGSTNVIETDLEGDGAKENVVADKNGVTIYAADGSQRVVFAPFGTKWKNGMEVAVGDVNGDGRKEIVVSAGPGGSPTVKVFDASGQELKSFLAYGASFKGGVHLATGNTDGKGASEIITGAGAGGGPHVRVWDGNGTLKTQFFAYATTFKGGAYVAAGDALGLGRDQIVTGAGLGGGPQVRIFDAGDKNKAVGSFFAFAKTLRTGVRVSASDLDGNGRAEILAESTDVFTVTSLGAPAPEIAEAEPRPDEYLTLPSPTIGEGEGIPERPLFLGMKF
jgi:hypothetical protein